MDVVAVENKQLANNFLNNFYYEEFRKGKKAIEIFLLGVCKANCTYCYLKKNQKELYPTNLHNQKQVLLNLKKLLKWYTDNNFCCNLDIFSAEWLTIPEFSDAVFNMFYES